MNSIRRRRPSSPRLSAALASVLSTTKRGAVATGSLHQVEWTDPVANARGSDTSFRTKLQEHLSNPTTEPGVVNISEAKRALLQKYLRGEVDGDLTSSRSIARRSGATTPQPSFAQERLWFLDQLMPASPVFNVPIAVRLSTPIDLRALQRSLQEIGRRHEVFRTTFMTVEGKPEPVVSADPDLQLAVIDLTTLREPEREMEARRLIKAEALRPFDLTRGPLIRTGLIRLNGQESIFLLTMHHIISDGWSIVLFFQELSALHRAFTSGDPSPLAELAIQFADYAAWQREWLRGEVLERQLSYWKNQLSGELPVLELPTDRPRPATQTYPGARAVLTLSRELSRALIALSHREGVTLFMTLLAGFRAAHGLVGRPRFSRTTGARAQDRAGWVRESGRAF